jgi:hypothetical protein
MPVLGTPFLYIICSSHAIHINPFESIPSRLRYWSLTMSFSIIETNKIVVHMLNVKNVVIYVIHSTPLPNANFWEHRNFQTIARIFITPPIYEIWRTFLHKPVLTTRVLAYIIALPQYPYKNITRIVTTPPTYSNPYHGRRKKLTRVSHLFLYSGALYIVHHYVTTIF